VHEAVLAAQAHQDDRRAQISELASMPVESFARMFITRDQVEAELVRLFPARGGNTHSIRAGMNYRPQLGARPEMPAFQAKLGLRLSSKELRRRDGERFELTSAGEKIVREAVRARMAETQIKTLRQATSQGLPRVVVDSGRVNVKLAFNLVEADKLASRRRGNTLVLSLSALSKLADTRDADRMPRLRVVVRPVDNAAEGDAPNATAGIGELDLTLKTI
jgi:hypothetical protein